MYKGSLHFMHGGDAILSKILFRHPAVVASQIPTNLLIYKYIHKLLNCKQYTFWINLFCYCFLMWAKCDHDLRLAFKTLSQARAYAG